MSLEIFSQPQHSVQRSLHAAAHMGGLFSPNGAIIECYRSKSKCSSECRISPQPLLYCVSRGPHIATMIRSNPTSIPLRASDLKHLQAELEKRKAISTTAAPQQQPKQSSGAQGAATPATGIGAHDEHDAVGAARRHERAGRTVAERIGL